MNKKSKSLKRGVVSGMIDNASPGGMCRNEMMERIKSDEGYRDRVYIDTVGVPTLGWGHALHEGSHVPLAVSELFFKNDFDKAEADADWLLECRNIVLNNVRRYVIINMVFNLGKRGVSNFKKMFDALQSEDYEEAARQMLDSKWAGQVGKRSTYLAELMRKGES